MRPIEPIPAAHFSTHCTDSVHPRRSTTVTHITITKKTSAKPRLEFYSGGSGDVRRITIENCPFRIGRAESADLRVELVEISREHAEIIERNGMWIVRDLGSTNGTQVNGRPIQEMLLADGDILKVAETEITFIASAASQFQRMVTQPIQSGKRAAPNALPPEVNAMRALTEATLRQVIPTKLLAATSLRRGVNEAYFSLATTNAKQQPILAQPHLLGERYRELERMRAVELTIKRTDSRRLYLAVGPTDLESPQRLLSNLQQLQDLLPGGSELGITISLSTDIDILQISDFYQDAREHELHVAFDEFQGNGAQVRHLKSLRPDYLVLAKGMTNDITSTRQPQRRLESLLAACDELAIQPVLPCMESAHAVAICQEIGFNLVLMAPSRVSERTADARVTV